MELLPVKYRTSTLDDKDFIYNSWLKSHRHSEECSRMNNETYYSNHKKIIENILKKANILICCNPEDESQIYGYIAFEYMKEYDSFVIHYCYVKYTFRKLGLARNILNAVFPELTKDPIVCTYLGKVYDKLKEKYLLVYNPFLR